MCSSDLVVVEKRDLLAGGREPQQPEGNRDAHELSRVVVVGQHAERDESRPRRFAPGRAFAMENRFVVFPDLDERRLSGEAGARLRELGVGVFGRRERCVTWR